MIAALDNAPENAPENALARARIGRAAAALLLSVATLWNGTTTAVGEPAVELPTGGLLLDKGAGLDVRSEDVYISPRQIRVSYRFYNASPEDVKTPIAFPMPDVTVADAAAGVPLPSEDPQNLLAFSTLVDGMPVKANVVQKVIARGVDRTAELERLKLPLAPHLRSTDKALGKLLPADADELTRNGLTAVEEYSVGRGMRKQLSPRWTLQTTHYWDQTFPAGKEVAIEHRYKPSVGKTAQTALGDPEAMQEGWFKDYVNRYCIDQNFLAAVERARKSAKARYGAPFSEERISFLLATGTNRPDDIGDFHLVVDTGDPGSLVSFCAEGVTRIGQTRYEVHKTDFLPTRDLHILILKPSRRR
jgi:hypothetical protein